MAAVHLAPPCSGHAASGHACVSHVQGPEWWSSGAEWIYGIRLYVYHKDGACLPVSHHASAKGQSNELARFLLSSWPAAGWASCVYMDNWTCIHVFVFVHVWLFWLIHACIRQGCGGTPDMIYACVALQYSYYVGTYAVKRKVQLGWARTPLLWGRWWSVIFYGIF